MYEHDTEAGHEPRLIGRYAELTLEEGGVVIYDTEFTDAWIQSDAPVSRREVI